ncbi:MAG: ribosome biogenesis GTP-binding protein YsxC [Pseudomonadales bacterium]|nr:ribosome biogenesis GTP-binding protein YsxC [Pseudomonadales bacterium]NIX08715.1 ribosome biogenesis GTP-binding protein YsxC [Pseudomonadales bacterium]
MALIPLNYSPPSGARELYNNSPQLAECNLRDDQGNRVTQTGRGQQANKDRGSADRLPVRFISSAPTLRQCPRPEGPEIAFAGRSNAGKSSVLNRITGSRSTAKVGKTPGRTRLLNFFAVEGGGRLVDLPGYGYAKAAKTAQHDWQASVNDYLSNRDALQGLVLVSDIRHPGQRFDMELLEWADASELPLLVLLNKADKLGRNAQAKALKAAKRLTETMPLVEVVLFSATSGLGNDTVVAWLREHLEGGG